MNYEDSETISFIKLSGEIMDAVIAKKHYDEIEANAKRVAERNKNLENEILYLKAQIASLTKKLESTERLVLMSRN